MPWNRNNKVIELLSWHGHDRGGVHIPFQPGGNPLGSIIETNLIAKLRVLAADIAHGNDVPRWIFLVGGPGNGKSGAIQDFLRHLDTELGMQGHLVQLLSQEFAPVNLVRRRVEVNSTDVAASPGTFASHVKRLIVVQDATATENAAGNAARELVDDIADLLSGPSDPIPLFVVCANRGLLTRALKEAYIAWGQSDDLTTLLAHLIKASSLGTDALASVGQRISCWPLATDPRVACWPLDFESLLVEHDTHQLPGEKVVESAVQDSEWEVPGRCADCQAVALCPFRQNAAWLREPDTRSGLITILRRGELFTGQRWNFRDTLSLTAELIVGQRSDFGNVIHPCDWVHSQVMALSPAAPPASAVAPTYSLLSHLYPHALFPVNWLQAVAETYFEDRGIRWNGQDISRKLIEALSNDGLGSSKPIRETLAQNYVKLDPATFTPSEADHILRLVENDYSQSVDLGNTRIYSPNLARVEKEFLELLGKAELEWNTLSRDATAASKVIYLLRRAASITVKRSLGVRLGHHAYENHLGEYEAALRETARLNLIKDALQGMLGGNTFQFNMLESFGQPRANQGGLVTLESSKPGVRVYPAPGRHPTGSVPIHDVPSFEVGGTGRMPITFDLYLALRLQKEGCTNSSLPASVRAAIDRIRHRYAGTLSKEKAMFVDGTASVVINGKFLLALEDEDAEPSVNGI